jgi:ATP-binding cassette subfamily B multidrug efflux pump
MKKKAVQEKIIQNEEDLSPEEEKRLENIDKERQMQPVGPVVSTRRGPMMFSGEKAKLEHPRSVLWRWIFSYLFRKKKLFILYTFLIALGSVISVITPLLTRSIIDNGIIARNTQAILIITILYLSLMVIMAFGNYIGSYGLGKIGQDVVYSMRNDVFEQLQKMSMSYFDKHPSGDLISRATNDIDQMNLLVGGQLVQIITSFLSIGLSITFMFVLSPFLALFGLLVFPVFFVMSKWFQNRVIGAFKETRKKISKVTSSIQENISGAKTVQAFGQEKKAMNEFDQANMENAEASFRARRIFATFFPLINFLSSTMTASVLVIGGYVSLINFAPFGIIITVGTLAAFIQYMSNFFQPFMMLTQIQQVIESAMASADRIYAVLDEEVDLPDPEHPVVIQDPKGAIDFEDVSFGYKFNGDLKQKPSWQKIIPVKSQDTSSDSANLPDNTQELNMQAISPFVQEMLNNPEAINRMIKGLEISLKSPTKMPSSGGASGMGAETGGMMGSSGGMGGRMDSSQLLRMLAILPLSEEITKKFPEIVKKAIEDEKILLEHESTIGYVLKHVNLKIDEGKTIAIVGRTGAGKTTFIKLTCRFYDVTDGKVLIDSVNVKDLEKKNLRDMIGLVPQDSFLFTGTIRENLLYGYDDENPSPEKKEQMEEKMIDVSKFLGLHNFIETLPKKYDTKLKENASNISIGQRQLTAFARALIQNPKILVLDEATSSVDPYTESLIQDALDRAREGRTTIIIAHRLSTIKNADWIVVLDQDKKGIVEQGTHKQLIAKENGVYKHLLDMQYKDIEVNSANS